MPELGKVVGANVRHLRGSVPMRTMVDAAKSIGARWSTGTASDLEAGRRRITVEDLVIAASALSDTTGRPVTVRDLLATNDRIELGDGTLSVTAETILEFLAGANLNDAFDLTIRDSLDRSRLASTFLEFAERRPPGQTLLEGVGAIQALTEADRRIASTMDLDPNLFAAWSAHLWDGRMFTEERDRRGAGENAQKRGRITRDMKAELAATYADHVPLEPMTETDLEHATEVLRSRGLIPDGGDRGDD